MRCYHCNPLGHVLHTHPALWAPLRGGDCHALPCLASLLELQDVAALGSEMSGTAPSIGGRNMNAATRSVTRKPVILFSLCLSFAGPPILAASNDAAHRDVRFLTKEEQSGDRYSAQLGDAWELFKREAPGRAATAFEKIYEAADAAPADRVQALFGLGLSHEYTLPFPRPQAAREAFQSLVREFPENSLVPWSLIELGKLAFKKTANLDYWNNRNDFSEARAYFRRVIDDYPNSVALHEAVIRLANTYCFEVEPPLADRGIEILEEHLAKYPDNPLAAGMYVQVSFWLISIKQDYERAIPYLEGLGEIRQGNPYRWSEGYWRVATVWDVGLRRPDRAIPWYRKIIEITPKSRHVLPAKLRLREISGAVGGRR